MSTSDLEIKSPPAAAPEKQKRRKFRLFLVLGLALALLAMKIFPARPFNEQLLQLSLRQTLGPLAAGFAAEPPELQALMLDYAPQPELVLKAKIALLKYPDLARRVFLTYGAEPEFQQILRDYGEAVLLPISYFMTHEISSLTAMHKVGKVWEDLKESWQQWLGGEAAAPPPAVKLGPEERGWIAVTFIKEEGYHFLGQFVVTKEGEVQWLQSDRLLQGLVSFLTGGVRKLEAKWRQGEPILLGDLTDAALDLIIVAGSFKLVKAANQSRKLTKLGQLPQRIRVYGSALLFKGGRLRPIVKYGVLATTGYLLVRHPSLLHSLWREAANVLGLPPLLLQVVGWTVVITLLLYPVSWLWALLSPPVRWLARAVC
jgi:hypothetical protein